MAKASTGAKTRPKILCAKRKVSETGSKDLLAETAVCPMHAFTKEEIDFFRKQLLSWYDKHQRKLPWRDIAKLENDLDKRGYAVWVSEVMLQQTQVSTVIPYYENWLKKWPTVQDLAQATLEDVNKLWAGLGYYSRAKRLHEGAKFVVESCNGSIPKTADELQNGIPGIGKYTACAIASVAFQQPLGVVDGNVSRVLSRLRGIGSEVSKPLTVNHLWKLANDVVSRERPGDFNQALMEFGAVLCTPRNPKCNECPLSELCVAHAMSENSKSKLQFCTKPVKVKEDKCFQILDIENNPGCQFCVKDEVWKSCPDVTIFPVKADKKKSRIEKIAVIVIEKDSHLVVVQRPETGLLAGLWEFPSLLIAENNSSVDDVLSVWWESIGISSKMAKTCRSVGEVLHIFSHIRTTYCVSHVKVDSKFQFVASKQNFRWLTREEFSTSAVSTAMKKVLSAVDQATEKVPKVTRMKRPCPSEDKKQKSIKSFFT